MTQNDHPDEFDPPPGPDNPDVPAEKGERVKSEEYHDPVAAAREYEERLRQEEFERIKNGSTEHLGISAFEEEIEYANIGDYIDLHAKAPVLRQLVIGAGWDQKKLDEEVDADISLFLLDKDDMTRINEDFIFYNNVEGCEGGVRHLGDSRSGAGDGDDEKIIIDLNSVPFDILKIMIVLSVYDEDERGHSFGLLRNTYLRLVDDDDDTELCRLALPDTDYDGMSAILVGALVREGPRWFFSALGEGVQRGGLAAIASRYGIIVKEVQSSG